MAILMGSYAEDLSQILPSNGLAANRIISDWRCGCRKAIVCSEALPDGKLTDLDAPTKGHRRKAMEYRK
jgi:hypothetical protein